MLWRQIFDTLETEWSEVGSPPLLLSYVYFKIINKSQAVLNDK